MLTRESDEFADVFNMIIYQGAYFTQQTGTIGHQDFSFLQVLQKKHAAGSAFIYRRP